MYGECSVWKGGGVGCGAFSSVLVTKLWIK